LEQFVKCEAGRDYGVCYCLTRPVQGVGIPVPFKAVIGWSAL
jgi:hypothetical protein